MNNNLERVKILPLSFLDKLSDVRKSFYEIIDGYSVKMNSQRYGVFKNSTKCRCGLVASYLAVERDILIGAKHYHINMYGVNAEGEEILFTKDHIIPKSKGGKNHISNYESMCVICNGEKGNNFNE